MLEHHARAAFDLIDGKVVNMAAYDLAYIPSRSGRELRLRSLGRFRAGKPHNLEVTSSGNILLRQQKLVLACPCNKSSHCSRTSREAQKTKLLWKSRFRQERATNDCHVRQSLPASLEKHDSATSSFPVSSNYSTRFDSPRHYFRTRQTRSAGREVHLTRSRAIRDAYRASTRPEQTSGSTSSQPR